MSAAGLGFLSLSLAPSSMPYCIGTPRGACPPPAVPGNSQLAGDGWRTGDRYIRHAYGRRLGLGGGLVGHLVSGLPLVGPGVTA